MPTIVYVIHEYPPVTQTFVWREIEGLRELGAEVRVYALKAGSRAGSGVWAFADVLAASLIPHIGTVLMRALRRRAAIFRLFSLPPRGIGARLRQIKAFGHAVVLSCLLCRSGGDVHLHAHFFGRTLDVLSYTRLLYAKAYSSSATGHAADATGPPSSVRLRAQLDELDLVVCASESVRRAMFEAIGTMPNTAIVRCGVEERDVAPDLLQDNLRICSIGRVVEKKGFGYAVSAATALRDRGVAYEWTFIGDGPERNRLTDASSDLVGDGLVRWLGHRDNRDVYTHLANSVDVLVQPSVPAADGDIDGIPIVLMEAMSMGIPVITTPISGIPELVDDPSTGYLCEPGDGAAIADSLLRIDRDRGEARTRGLAGRRHVQNVFSRDREAERLLKLISATWSEKTLTALRCGA